MFPNNPVLQQPTKRQCLESTACATSSYLQTEMRDHPASIGVTFGLHVNFPSRC